MEGAILPTHLTLPLSDSCEENICAYCDPTMQCGCVGLGCEDQCSGRTNKCEGRGCDLKEICRDCIAGQCCPNPPRTVPEIHSCGSCWRIFCCGCLVKDCNKELVEGCIECVQARTATVQSMRLYRETTLHRQKSWAAAAKENCTTSSL